MKQLFTKQVQLFELKYLGATNNLSQRVKIIDCLNNQSKTLSIDYSFENMKEQAINFLKKEGYKIASYGQYKGSHIIICEAIDYSFKPLNNQ